MNEDVKKKWLGALNSGEYEQGDSRLVYVDKNDDGKTKTSYCCLGVLCDLAVKDGVDVAVAPLNYHGDTENTYGYSYDGYEHYLPPSVMEWAGLDHENPKITHGHYASVAQANDGGLTFAEISTIIEASL